MSQSSQANTKPSPQSTNQQNTKPKTVPGQVWFALILALAVIVIFVIIPPIMSDITYFRTFDTISPTATVTAAQVQEVSNMTNQQAVQNKSLLDIMTSFATVMGAVLAVFAVVTIGLGAIGYFSNNAFRDLQDKYTLALKENKAKGKAMTKLQQDMEQKQEDIDTKQKSMDKLVIEMKSKVGDLEKESRKTNAYVLITFGNLLLEQGRGTRAVQVFENALNDRPDVPETNYLLGRTYSSLADFDKAIQYLSDALKLDNNFPQAHMELGLAYRRRGDTWYDKGILENDEWKKKEWLSKAQDDYEQAVQHLTQAITLRPDYEDALAVLGGLYRRLGAYENNDDYFKKAHEYYEKAFKAKPKSSYALANAASFLWYFGKDEEAVKSFARVKTITQERIDKPEDLAGIHWDYYDLALSQLVLGETEQAIDTYSKAIEMTKNPIDFDGVWSNLKLLQTAPKSIKDLDKIITMVELKMGKTT